MLQIRRLALALLASSVTLVACNDDDITGTNANNATVQFINATAVSLAMDNEMPIVVFDMTQPGNIVRAVRGEPIGTLIGGEVSG